MNRMQIPPDRLAAARAAMLQQLLPAGVPVLWCPLLTHYDADGAIDLDRLDRQLAFLRGSIDGYLIPGSTGDGWQLDEAQVREVLDFALDAAPRHGFSVLIGVLATSGDDVLRRIDETMAWLRRRAVAAADDLDCLRRASVCGFTVCPPKGAQLTQAQIEAVLERELDSGLPIALYQLPQVTDNEMSAETVAALARRHPNFLLLKDTSGADRVAASGLRDILLVRGAEGGYAGQLALGGGAYDGLLLSSANGLGPQLRDMIGLLQDGREADAQALSARIERCVDAVFAAAAALPYGNVFTNANKAIDHCMAHGPQARSQPGPRVHSGERLPAELIATAADALERDALMPTRGYLER